MANFVIYTFIFCGILQVCFAPPVTQNKEDKEGKGQNEAEVSGLEDYMEYHRYLREVVNALESDPEFRTKLEKAEEHDIRSGKIAEELEFVSHHVRTRLDELKRIELERLKELMEKKRKLEQESDGNDSHGHLDHSNPHTFEIEDLKKLISKTTQDLAEADKQRRQEFKEYELQKEYEKQKKLNDTNGEERDKLEKQFKEQEEKHKQHEKLHEPGHKAQLEEVWEEQDQMQQEFDPKTFFMLHDIDGNGLWDQDEVKALFIKELDKMYSAGASEDDMRERVEEMERMRESVFKEVDLNRDGFIDYEEFLAQTRRNDFQQDHGWQTVDEQRPYTDEELSEYIRQHEANRMNQGYPPHPGYHPDPRHPQAYAGQVPPGGYQPHPNQVPQGQYHPGQVPQYQGQVPPHPAQQMNNNLPDLNTNEVYQKPVQGNYNHPPIQYQQPNHQQPQYQQQNQHFQQSNQQYHQQPNQQFQKPTNQQFQQPPNQQFQQPPNQQFQQPPPNQQYQQHPNQQPNIQYQQAKQQPPLNQQPAPSQAQAQPQPPVQQQHNPNVQANLNQNSQNPNQDNSAHQPQPSSQNAAQQQEMNKLNDQNPQVNRV